MATLRKTPQALNEPLRILGVRVYEIAFALFLALFLSHWGMRIAAGGLALALATAKWIEGIDPRWYNTMRIAAGFKALYDPLLRETFHTEVIE